jgi:hypothetical protein
MVVHGHRQDPLGALLADDVLIENFLDFLRLGELIPGALSALFQLLPDYVVAQLDAFVADENARAGNELPNLVLALSTEGAVQELAVIMFAARIFAHAVLKLAVLPAPGRPATQLWYRLYSTQRTPRKDKVLQGVTGVRNNRRDAGFGRT